MAETSLGVSGAVKTILQSAAAGFAFGEVALLAAEPSLTTDGVLLTAATLAAGRVGSTGAGVVAACLAFSSALVSLGSGFLLAAAVTKLLTKGGVTRSAEATAGACVAAGAVATGLVAGILPPWVYVGAQAVLVLLVVSNSNINDMTTALAIIFVTLYLCVAYGRTGVFLGLFLAGLSVSVLCALRKALAERMSRRAKSKTECKLLERIFFYSVVVGALGFFVGLGAGEAGEASEAEMALMLQSVLWVAYVAAGLLGAGLGTVVTVGLRPEAAGTVAVGAAVVSSASLRAVVHLSASLGTRSSVGAALGAAAAAGVSLGAASVAAKAAFGARNSTLAAIGSVALGAVAAMRGGALAASAPTTSELVTVTLVAAGSFLLGAPKSPFHTQVNLQVGLVAGPELIRGVGMETLTAASAPFGAGALGAAALATAALGRVGTAGIAVAVLLAMGSVLSGIIGNSPPTTNARRD
ncbi:uncharacterized protein LOC119194577 [Pungitius pungitius]|uniref:uncharacterized protein LOC119194577 n=1 Tax=Pungitius pungitius TaxID=134920 RepID=UPI0018877F64|nr:uncharacterized protein LOC119194577 [Pungitius pungitius]